MPVAVAVLAENSIRWSRLTFITPERPLFTSGQIRVDLGEATGARQRKVSETSAGRGLLRPDPSASDKGGTAAMLTDTGTLRGRGRRSRRRGRWAGAAAGLVA